jgi:phosphatidylglycerophosphatase A
MRPHALHPATLLSTWFWVGLIPRAPGTFGSLAALPFAWTIQTFWGPLALLAGALLVFAVGCWSSAHYIRDFEESDPGEVVIDEVAGQWVACLLLPPDMPWAWLAAFVLFRMFDIFKPWPISVLDRRGRGGVGIMQDDMLAGLFAFILLQLFLILFAGGPWIPTA